MIGNHYMPSSVDHMKDGWGGDSSLKSKIHKEVMTDRLISLSAPHFHLEYAAVV